MQHLKKNCFLVGETVTGELSKLLDEIKLCQEKDYSFEDLCHTISDHYLDNLSKISEEELGKNGSQSVVSKGGMKTMRPSVFRRLSFQCGACHNGMGMVGLLGYQVQLRSNVSQSPVSFSLLFTGLSLCSRYKGRRMLGTD